MHPYNQKRSAPRIRPKIPLYVESPERRSVRDISLSGAFIEDKHPLPPGQRFQLRFWLGAIEPLVVDAAIRRVEEGEGMGVEFLSMTPADYDHLRAFLHTAPQ